MRNTKPFYYSHFYRRGIRSSTKENAFLISRSCNILKIISITHHPKRCRIVPELKEQGIREYRELISAPYRIFFRLTEKKVGIVGILDGRRDLEELILQRALLSPFPKP